MVPIFLVVAVAASAAIVVVSGRFAGSDATGALIISPLLPLEAIAAAKTSLGFASSSKLALAACLRGLTNPGEGRGEGEEAEARVFAVVGEFGWRELLAIDEDLPKVLDG